MFPISSTRISYFLAPSTIIRNQTFYLNKLDKKLQNGEEYRSSLQNIERKQPTD